MAKDIFKMDFCNIVKFDCSCGRRYINTSNCRQCTCSDEKQTNADRIRSMTDEELAEFLEKVELGDLDYSITFCDMCKAGGNALNLDCKGCLKHWLQKDSEV